MKDKAVVVGGSGFLGSHIADELTGRGYDVTVYDVLESPWIKEGQSMVRGTLDDEDLLRETISGVQYVFHLAGIAEIRDASARPLDVIQSNILGSAKVIEACLASGSVERLVFASSVYVYSNQGSFYRVSKQAVELMLESYQMERGLEYTILRYGSLYGPRSQDWNGLKGLVKQAVASGTVSYPGTGEERREYIHVEDAAALSVDILAPQYANKCFTLTGTQVLTSKELMHLIREILGGNVELKFSSETEGTGHYGLTPYRYIPKEARKIVPTTFYDLGQGILELIEEVRNEQNGSDNRVASFLSGAED